MKQVYLVGGTMGVGKTHTCQLLKQMLNNSVFLDGDWCWDAHPFQVTEETKQMVLDNICHLLNNFIACSAYEHVIFCWVMHEQGIIDAITERLALEGCRLHCISLTCSAEALKTRLGKDVEKGRRQAEIIERSIERLPFYEVLDTLKLDVSAVTPQQAAEKLRALAEEKLV